MTRLIAIIAVLSATIGGAFAGSVTYVDLATTPQLYYGSCSVGTSGSVGQTCTPSTPTLDSGTFLNTTFATVQANQLTPNSSSPVSSTAGVGFIIDANSASASSNANDDYYVEARNNGASVVDVDLGNCTGLTPTGCTGVTDAAAVYLIIGGLAPSGTGDITVTLTGQTHSGTVTLTSGEDYLGANSTTLPTCDDANATVSGACNTGNSDVSQVNGNDTDPGGTLGAETFTYNNAFGAMQATSGTNYYLDVVEITDFSVFNNLEQISLATNSGKAYQMVLAGITVTSTPEPGTIAMMFIGIGMIAIWTVRRRHAKQATATTE
jgi:hypothetical protein